MSKTKAGSKPAKTTRAKTADKTKAVKPAAKQPRKKAAPARKPLPKAAAQPVQDPADRYTGSIISGVSTPAQASALYGGLEKNEARRVHRQFYAAGRRDLAAAPRTLPS